ncbi:protein kinase [Amycolatopsis sp. NPDC098790]|uniref:methylation-associated defense system protein kinase MAD6 n=1 Tax=Amycolatopsis sp. NPDC098790 TaxID=3363939 RepID=UPI0037F71DE9
MARIVGGGTPANDAERLVIAHLRDHGPDEWQVVHNIEIPVRGVAYEVDIVVVTGHNLCLIDVKGVHGRVVVERYKWYPERGNSYGSPVRKLRGHARALKGKLAGRHPELSRMYVDQLVVMPVPGAYLVDRSSEDDADGRDVTDLDGLIPMLADLARVRTGMNRDIRQHFDVVMAALWGSVRVPTGPKRFNNWEVVDTLGGDDEVTEYRARNATVGSADTVLLRVYNVDAFAAEDQRVATQHAIANAYEVLTKMPPNPYVIGRRDFFPVEDDSQFVLVLEDVRGQALTVYLANPRRALGTDTRLRLTTDLLRGLAHVHGHNVLHRALSPAAVLVSADTGRAVLTGFDYGKPEEPREHTVLGALAARLDAAYVAPECQQRPQGMSKASDVYAAGVIAFQLLTGELPFASSTEQISSGSELPSAPMAAAGLSPALTALLRRMCARSPKARPSASEALRELARLSRPGAGSRSGGDDSSSAPGRLDYAALPVGHQLTRKFTIRRFLGTGSFGTAYLAFDNLAGLDRVVKIVYRDRESVVARLTTEYRILLGLSHPSVVRVIDANYLDGSEVPYLVFDYVDGTQVDLLAKRRTLGPADTVRLGVDVAEGLTYLHDNGIYHCDIKPKNLLHTDTGCKIFDFNVAVAADSTLSRVGGTSRYAPPDFGERRPVTLADLADRDIYGLGLTLYEVLTGLWPFSDLVSPVGQEPVDPRTRPVLADLSDELVAVLLRAISPLRSARYGSAREFRDALVAIGDRVHRPTEPPVGQALPTGSTDEASNARGAGATSSTGLTGLVGPSGSSVPDVVVGENRFVAHLKTLYSQSTSSNAGTRSGAHQPYDLYVRTALDDRLTPDVLGGAYQLVIITGNAGDGKTAYLERLLTEADADSSTLVTRRDNGSECRLPSGLRLLTNHDGSQDEGDQVNDDVLRDFFGPFAGNDLAGDVGETRLIAINEGRLVDFIDSYRDEFPALSARVRAGLADEVDEDEHGDSDAQTVVLINLNRRSLFHSALDSHGDPDDDAGHTPVFDRMLARLTDPDAWAECAGCDLANQCYALHNARTFAHSSAGPKITARLRRLYRLAELRGVQHITVRDVQSALAFMLTSGRDCTQIHRLYARDQADEILAGFYFTSWAGRSGTADRLLALLSEVDVVRGTDPALDRKLDFVGPDGGRALMTIDQRGNHDEKMLAQLARQLPRDPKLGAAAVTEHTRYLAAARGRFYFECVDDERSSGMLPYRSAARFAAWLSTPDLVGDRLGTVIAALNRSEGLGELARTGDALALRLRMMPKETIRSYRLFPAENLTLSTTGAPTTPYVEGSAAELVLVHHGAGGHQARLRVRLDLFELLWRLGQGYLPGVAERQGLNLGLTIFKNELSAAPYQELLLTTTGADLWRVSREPGGKVRMEPLTAEEGVQGGAAQE